MRILIFSDPHVHPYGQFSPLKGDSSQRLIDLNNSFQWIYYSIREYKPDLIVCCGDWHEKPVLDAVTIKWSSMFYQELCDTAIDVEANFRIIPGNHDQISDDIHCMSYMTLADGRHFTRLHDDFMMEDGICYLPYMRDLDYYTRCIEACPTDSLLFTHMDVIGARLNSSYPSMYGVKSDIFKKFRHVFIGHLHHPQEIAENITYVGSLTHNHFGDDNNNLIPRGITMYENGFMEHVENPHSPRFIQFDIENEDDVSSLDSLGMTVPRDLLYIRVKSALPLEQVKSHLDGFRGYSFQSSKVERVSRSNQVVKFTSTYSKKDFLWYVDNHEPKNLDREIVVAQGQQIMEGISIF